MCRYCNKNGKRTVTNPIFEESAVDTAVRLDIIGNELRLSIYGESRGFDTIKQIKYCPFCGVML